MEGKNCILLYIEFRLNQHRLGALQLRFEAVGWVSAINPALGLLLW
jgi:hypothetical protein